MKRLPLIFRSRQQPTDIISSSSFLSRPKTARRRDSQHTKKQTVLKANPQMADGGVGPQTHILYLPTRRRVSYTKRPKRFRPLTFNPERKTKRPKKTKAGTVSLLLCQARYCAKRTTTYITHYCTFSPVQKTQHNIMHVACVAAGEERKKNTTIDPAATKRPFPSFNSMVCRKEAHAPRL